MSSACHTAGPPFERPQSASRSGGSTTGYTSESAGEEQIAELEEPTSVEAYGRRIALDRRFEPTILVLILVSSLCLALESPYRSRTSFLSILVAILDLVLTVAFTGEMVVKMMAFGVWKHSRSLSIDGPANSQESGLPYFRVGWNMIDFIAVISGLLSLIMGVIGVRSAALRQLRTFRLVRVLRPLRLIKRFIGIRLIIESLIASLPTLANMVAIASLMYIGFGILLVNTLKGSLWACSLDPDGTLYPYIDTKDDCIAAGGKWEQNGPNFDNLGESLLVLIPAGCGEGWLDILLKVVNSRGIDLQPRPNSRLHMGGLIIVFVAMSNFILLNLFIGVLVDQYVATKSEILNSEHMGIRDAMWLRMQREVFLQPRVSHVSARPRRSSYREKEATLCIDVESTLFHAAVSVCIVVNTVLLCLEHPTQSEGMRSTLSWGSNIFVVIFVAEASMKIFVYRWSYFGNVWDVFDFVITAASCISLLVSITPALRGTWFAEFVDMFRVGRTLRLGRIHLLRPMFRTLWDLLPGLANIVGLLTLLLFIYACLGIGFFGTLADGEELGPNSNFHSIGMAILTLVRCATGEEWQLLMNEAASRQPGCLDDLQSPEDLERDGPLRCGTWLSYPFFISFTLMVSVVLMNLVVAVVLDGYLGVEQVERLKKLKVHTDEFIALWLQAESQSGGYLPLTAAVEMLSELGHPFGFSGGAGGKAKAWRVMKGLRCVPIQRGNTVHIRDILLVCAQRAFVWTIGGVEEDCSLVQFDEQAVKEWYASFPDVPGFFKGINTSREAGSTDLQLYVDHAWLAKLLHSRWRTRRIQRGRKADAAASHRYGHSGAALRCAGTSNDDLMEPQIPQAHFKHAVVMTSRTQRRLAEEMQRRQQQQQEQQQEGGGGVWAGWTITTPASLGPSPAGSPFTTASNGGPLLWPPILPPRPLPAAVNSESAPPSHGEGR